MRAGDFDIYTLAAHHNWMGPQKTPSALGSYQKWLSQGRKGEFNMVISVPPKIRYHLQNSSVELIGDNSLSLRGFLVDTVQHTAHISTVQSLSLPASKEYLMVLNYAIDRQELK